MGKKNRKENAISNRLNPRTLSQMHETWQGKMGNIIAEEEKRKKQKRNVQERKPKDNFTGRQKMTNKHAHAEAIPQCTLLL
jgi:hypothetical protein